MIAIELSIVTLYFYKQVHLDGVRAVATIIMGVVALFIWNPRPTRDLFNTPKSMDLPHH
jgi:hypothetical protein